MKNKLVINTIIVTCVSLFISIYFLKQINLINTDTGRHITNGKWVFENKDVLFSNFYSYTETDHNFINHHWLSGYIFYIVWLFGGFKLLSILNFLLKLLTTAVFVTIGKFKGNAYSSAIPALLLIPLITQRTEIRPEVISYLLFGIYFLLITLYKNKILSFRKLILILIPLQILWVNSHIFFIFGIFLFGTLLIENLVKKKNIKLLKKELTLVALISILSLLSPFFYNGLLEPLNIFKEYGYMIAENQSIWFMQKRNGSFMYLYTELITILAIAGLIKKRRDLRKDLLLVINFTVFCILAFSMNRLINLYGLILIPTFAFILKDYDKQKIKNIFLIVFSSTILISFLPNNPISITSPNFGIGVMKESDKSIEFFTKNNLKGPVFNNYDIGSYLIFRLFPKERVFVDNRPEAYSLDFFNKTYIPMQENEEFWQEKSSEYNFNTIYFYRLDMTPWGQPFLINRIKDEEWVPVYVDMFTIILVKNNEQNKDIIKNHKIPQDYFVITEDKN